MFTSAAVVVTVALAAPALAAANTTHATDPRDARGALDIQSVTGTHNSGSGNVIHTLRTYKPFRSQILTHNTFITFAFDTNSDGKLDDVAIVVWFRGALRSALLDTAGDLVGGPLKVTGPDSRTVRVTIPPVTSAVLPSTGGGRRPSSRASRVARSRASTPRRTRTRSASRSRRLPGR